MPLSKWKKISEQLVVKNAWWSYKKDETELPSGKHGEYHYVYTHGASMVVPLLDDGKILLVNQYRYLNDRESLEFPCGGVKEGHTYEQTAVQELEEEAGLVAGELQCLGGFNPYNGVTVEICNVYLATRLTTVPPKPEETEEFETMGLGPEEIDDYISSGRIWDGMTMAAWALARQCILAKKEQ